MLAFDPIHTPRTEIRAAAASDVPALANAVASNADRLARWMGERWVDLRATADGTRSIVNRWARAAESGTHLLCVVQSGGALVGQLELSRVRPLRGRHRASARIAWWLVDGAERQGLMTEALTAFLKLCTGPLAIRRLLAVVSPDNERSQALAMRCGFVPDGEMTLVIGGRALLHRRFTLG